MKITIMQVTFFFIGPIVNLLINFIVISFYIELKWVLLKNLSTVLPFKSNFSRKFQRFNATDGSIKILTNSYELPQVSIKMKNLKTFYEAQTAVSYSKERIQPPTTQKLKKNFLTELHRNIKIFAFQTLWYCSSWASGNGAVQIIFQIQTRNIFAENFVNRVRPLVVLTGCIFYNVEWV